MNVWPRQGLSCQYRFPQSLDRVAHWVLLCSVSRTLPRMHPQAFRKRSRSRTRSETRLLPGTPGDHGPTESSRRGPRVTHAVSDRKIDWPRCGAPEAPPSPPLERWRSRRHGAEKCGGLGFSAAGMGASASLPTPGATTCRSSRPGLSRDRPAADRRRPQAHYSRAARGFGDRGVEGAAVMECQPTALRTLDSEANRPNETNF